MPYKKILLPMRYEMLDMMRYLDMGKAVEVKENFSLKYLMLENKPIQRQKAIIS